MIYIDNRYIKVIFYNTLPSGTEETENSENIDRSKKMNKLNEKIEISNFCFVTFFSDQPFLSY